MKRYNKTGMRIKRNTARFYAYLTSLSVEELVAKMKEMKAAGYIT